MPVRRTFDADLGLTELIVSGHVVEEEMYEALDDFYNNQPTLLLLWDMSHAEVSHISPNVLLQFVQRAAKLSVARPGGRTAVHAPDDLQFGLGRMSQAFHDAEDVTFAFNIFRTREEAIEWLTADEDNG